MMQQWRSGREGVVCMEIHLRAVHMVMWGVETAGAEVLGAGVGAVGMSQVGMELSCAQRFTCEVVREVIWSVKAVAGYGWLAS
jgi:hypothetical protein